MLINVLFSVFDPMPNPYGHASIANFVFFAIPIFGVES